MAKCMAVVASWTPRRCVAAGVWAAVAITAGSASAQTAYFSLEGDFNTAGDQLDFSVDVNWGNVSSADDLGFQTLADNGGTNRAGDTVASGGIDSILELLNSFTPGDSYGINDDYDSINVGLDSFLTWPGNTPNPAGANVPLDENDLPPGGGDFVRMTTFNNNGTGTWALDLFGPATDFALGDMFNSTLSSGTATFDSLKFGTDGGAGTATVTLRLNHTFLGDVVVGETGRGRLVIVPFNPSDNSNVITVNGLLRANTVDRIELTGGTLQANGGVSIVGGIFEKTGGTLNLGNGETFSVSSNGVANVTGDLVIDNDETYLAESGGDLTVTGELRVGDNGQAGTLTVDSLVLESILTATGGVTRVGAFGSTGTLNVRGQDARADLALLAVARDNATGATDGTVNIEDGADVTVTALSIGNFAGNVGTGAVTVTDNPNDDPSTLTVTGAAATVIGNTAGDGAHTLNVHSNAAFVSGSGDTHVNASGTVNVTSNASIAINGDLNVDGGAFNSIAAGFDLAANRTVTVSNDGQLNLNTGVYTLFNGRTFSVNTGGDVTTTNGLDIGSANTGTVTIDGDGSTLDVGPGNTFWGLFGGNGSVTLSNQAAGDVASTIQLAILGDDSTGTITVESDADLNIHGLRMATGQSNATGTTATVTVTGAGSTITQLSQTVLEVGGPGAGSTATLNINDGGVFTTSIGDSFVRPTGAINLGGGTLNVNHQLYIDGGTFNQTAGDLNLTAGESLIVREGGLFDWTGGGGNSLELDVAGSVVRVQDAGSLFRAKSGGDGMLVLLNGTSINVTNTATLETDELFLNHGSLVVDNATLTATTGGTANGGVGFHQIGFNTDGSLTVRNSAAADLRLPGANPGVLLGQFSANGDSEIIVQSGGTLDLDTLEFSSGEALIEGTGSRITQTPGSAFTVGTNGTDPEDLALFTVRDGGTFNAGAGAGTKRIRPSGVARVNAGGLLDLNGTLTNDGLLRGNGGIIGDLHNQSLVIPDTDNTAGFVGLTIEGAYTQTTDGTIQFGPIPGNTNFFLDLVTVTQGLDLAGLINFVDDGGVPPTITENQNGGESKGDANGGTGAFETLPTYTELTLIDVTNLVPLDSVFENVSGHILGDGTAIAVLYTSQDVVAQRVLYGDGDLSMQIEQADLDAVLQNWGKTSTDDGISWVTGDYNGSGQVEQGDLDAVLQNWGDQLNAPDFTGYEAFAVPEPAALPVLLALAGAGVRRGRPRRFARD